MDTITPIEFTKLLSFSWGNHVPALHETESKPHTSDENLKNLREITELVRNTLSNAKDLHHNTQQIIQRCICFTARLFLENSGAALKAKRICQEAFKGNDFPVLSPWKFEFSDGKKFTLPEVYKDLLSRESEYFNGVFTSPFKEATNHVINLGDISQEEFFTLIKVIENPLKETLDAMDSLQLTSLINRVGYFLIDSLYEVVDHSLAHPRHLASTNPHHLENSDELSKLTQKYPFLQQTKSVLDHYYIHTLLDLSSAVPSSLEFIQGCSQVILMDLAHHFINDAQFSRLLTYCSNIETLIVTSYVVSLVQEISLCKNLKTLIMRGCSVKDDNLQYLSNLTKLEHIQFHNMPGVNVNSLFSIPGLVSSDVKTDNEVYNLLNKVMIDVPRLTGEGFKYFRNLPLKVVLCDECSDIEDVALEYLSHNTALHTLSFKFCYKLTDEGLEKLSVLPNLTEAKFSFGKITKEKLQQFVKSLKKIDKAADE